MSAPTDVAMTRRYEWATFEGVWNREFTLFKRFWLSTTISSVVQPIIYLLAFGLGVGTLVSQVDGISYVEFVGTGSVATAVLFASAFPGHVQHLCADGSSSAPTTRLLAAPVSVDELALAEGTWIAAKAGFYGSFPLIVTFFFGLTPTWGMLLVPIIGFVTGLGFAFFGMWVGATSRRSSRRRTSRRSSLPRSSW